VIKLSGAAVAAMVAHAREASPDECCGLLLGTGEEIVASVRTRNVADAPATRFLIDPRDHIAARRDARGRGLDVRGFYHSHPRSPATPSETDRAEAAYPDHLYAIVSLAADPADVRLFRFAEGHFLPLPFVTVG
jgi:proteasome lid subunit RPN8/RPN11